MSIYGKPKLLISVDNIGKSFRRRQVLKSVSFTVRRGEIFGILGKNGAGKTLLINILLGLIQSETGSVRLAADRQRINVASPFLSLQTHATIFDNLRLFARLYGVAEPEKKIERLVEEFGIKELADRHQKLFHLSAGEMTRTILAKAFINDPELVFLDEPTAALDPVVKMSVIKLVKKLRRRQKTTFVYTSHNLDEVVNLCSRVLVLKDGRATYVGPTPPGRTLIRYY